MSKEVVNKMIKRMADGIRQQGGKPNIDAIKKKAIEAAKRNKKK
jgi:hypothetical protein